MTSSINPNDIDGTYPVAGQDNDSQGFRDNFTNTKTNFQYASAEITDLQNKSVLKAALTGTTLDNDMAGSPLTSADIANFSANRVALGTTSGTVTINYATGHYQTVTTSGAISLAFANFPAAGAAGLVRVQITVSDVSHTVTLPVAVSVGTTGIQGYSSNVITFQATGTYEFEFVTNDGGASVTIFDLNRPLLGSNQAQIGYATGAGGAVTQATDKSTGVTLNTLCGQITMNAAALAAAAEVSFTLTNSFITATDVLIVNVASGATAATYTATIDAVAAGSARITVGNYSASSQSEAVVLNFVVINAVIS
jgi:hypothetical protein